MAFHSKKWIKSRKLRLRATMGAFLVYLGIIAAVSQVKKFLKDEDFERQTGENLRVLELQHQPLISIRSLLENKNDIVPIPLDELEDNEQTKLAKEIIAIALNINKTTTTTPKSAAIPKDGTTNQTESKQDITKQTATKQETTAQNATQPNTTVKLRPQYQAGFNHCLRAAIEQFPRPAMSLETRQSGGLLIHIIVTLYLFVAIAIVCDEFFVPSLEMLCDRMEMSEDVAGATFMAAGSSAPELATSIIAVFVAKDDIGISGVIGSAVFNILFVIAICAIFAGHVVPINWWPLLRDTVSYCISIFALLITIANEVISWYEGLFLLILYGLYILLMVYNKEAEAFANTLNIPFKSATREEKSSLFEGGVAVPLSQQGAQKPAAEPNGSQAAAQEQSSMEIEASQPKSMVPERKEEEVNPWQVPVGLWERIKWGTTLPIVAVHLVSIPDCRKVQWRRWYMGTFFMSMVWISLYSYVMVWMITIIGFTMGIPDTVMGLTLIAIGVSVSDVLSSLCVAKQGFGDMAVSNAIGSNVFDILICLGLPWFLKTAIVDPGSTVPVESRGLTYSTLSLFSTVIFLIGATHYNGWKLDVKYGIALMVWYVIFMLIASMYELNVFGYFNPPTCYSPY